MYLADAKVVWTEGKLSPEAFNARSVTDAYAYDACGRVLAQSGTIAQPFRFNGRFGIRADGNL